MYLLINVVRLLEKPRHADTETLCKRKKDNLTMRRMHQRRRKPPPRGNLQSKAIGIGLLGLSCVYILSLYHTHSFLDSEIEARGIFRTPHRLHFNFEAQRPSIKTQIDPWADFDRSKFQLRHGPPPRLFENDKTSSPRMFPHEQQLVQPNATAAAAVDRFIIFVPIAAGQGLGNIMTGLLSAHLLADEFDRIVCVTKEYDSFLEMFEPIQPATVEKCPFILVNLPVKNTDNSIDLINYKSAPNECKLQKVLKTGPTVLFLIANTYPRWPPVPTNYFFRFYKAKPNLQSALPYSTPPRTVVHLRQADGASDPRKGLDNATLLALGALLPHDTYLVTNQVDWYETMENAFGWRHPNWTVVYHSALHRSWNNKPGQVIKENVHDQQLQLWVDWYSLLKANQVYHTHSDFSISAVHWTNKESKSIVGVDAAGVLQLTDESYRVDGETTRLVDRTVTGQGTAMLRLCGQVGPLGSRGQEPWLQFVSKRIPTSKRTPIVKHMHA
jgi:hypothetical protein